MRLSRCQLTPLAVSGDPVLPYRASRFGQATPGGISACFPAASHQPAALWREKERLLLPIAVFPLIANIISGAKLSALAFTGSSIIIVVGVVLETARELESQMTMRHYKGFLE